LNIIETTKINQKKYSTYSWFEFIKHIYFAILINIKIIVSQWVKYHLAALDSLTWTFPWILITWTLHWRINWGLQSGHYLANIITLDYAMRFYTLWHINHPRADTSHYSLLGLAMYIKLLLGLPLVLGSYCILYIN
jgi:hypothetical protein